MKSVAFGLFVLTSTVSLALTAEDRETSAPDDRDATLPLQATSMPEIWQWCDGEAPAAFKDVEVLFQNYPLVPGENVTIVIRGEVTENLDDLMVKTSATINRFINITDVQNLCRGPWKRCPMAKGFQEQKFTYPVPSMLFGSLSTKATLYSAGKPVACMKVGPLIVQPPKNRLGQSRK